MVKEEIYKNLINIYPFQNKSEDDEDGEEEDENKAIINTNINHKNIRKNFINN